jgi:hypothetical protein
VLRFACTSPACSLQSRRFVPTFVCNPYNQEKVMRRIMVSISALVLACAKSGTRQAQDDAQQQYQNAAGAQKRATEEQQKAEQAQLDVTKAQKALADAQARLVGQRAKAEQAQRDALQMGRDSQERGALMQEQATQLQRQEARQGTQTQQGNQQAWMKTRNIRGSVAAVSPGALTVHSDDQGDVRLQVSDSTAISLDGRTATMKDIPEGSAVRASYGLVDGQATAVRLEVISSEASRSNASAPAIAK